MKSWTQILLRFDTVIFQLKTKLAEEKHILLVFLWGLLTLAAMLLQALIALPLYIFLTPSKLKKEGASEKEIKVFVLKRQVTFSALALFVLIIVVKIFFAGAIISLLFPSKKASAANVSWGFANPSEYVYDTNKIQIVSGIALFKATNPQPSPTEPTPTSTIIETIISQAPTVAPTIAAIEVPAPTTAPIPVIATATPIPEPTLAPIVQPTSAPAPTTPPVQESIPTTAPPVEAPSAPVLAAETSCEATIQPVASLVVANLSHWTSFSESAVTNNGTISYQLSDNDGQTWQYWNGVAWTAGDSWNSAAEVNSHLLLFPATGKLLFRAKLQGNCTQDMQLLGITADYDTKTIAVPTVIPTLTPIPTAVPVLEAPTSLPTITIVPTQSSAIPLITPTPTPQSLLDTIVSGFENLFGIPTPTPAIPTPTVEVTTPVATASSSLIQTEITIKQPVPLIAPTTVAASASGVEATLTIPGSQGYNLPTHFSISGAFSLNALGTSTQIVAKAGSYSFGRSSDGKQLILTLTNAEGITETIEAPLPSITGNQVNVAIATYDGTVVKLYLNGALLGTKNVQTTVAATQTNVSISAGDGVNVNANVNPFVLYNTILTPEEIALRYLQVNNFPAELVVTGMEQIGGGDVRITYKLVDQNSHVLALDVYEYSTTGAFAGEQHVMTQNFDNSLHEGIHDLTSSLTGTTHTFIWKASQDVADLANTTVYVKLRPFDGILSGQGSIASLRITTKPQTATIIDVNQQLNGQVQLHYSLIGTDPNATVALEVSQDGGQTWQQAATVTGAGSVTTGIGKTLVWDAEKDLSGHEVIDTKLRLHVTDSLGNSGYSLLSTLSLDTKAPFGLADFHAVATTQTTATLAWTPVSSEIHFKSYAIWYGTNRDDVVNETGTARIFTNNNDSLLSLQGTSAVILPNLSANTTYFAKLVATDTLNHASTLPVIEFTTGTTQVTLSAPILNQPATPPTPLTNSGPTAITVSGITTAGARVGLYVNGTLSQESFTTANNLGEFSGTVELAPGTHALTVIATVNSNITPQSNTVIVAIETIAIPTTIPTTQVSLVPTISLPTPTSEPTPTSAPVINQIITTIGDIITNLFGGTTPTPTPIELSLTPIPTISVPTPTEILPTLAPLLSTTPVPSLPEALPTPIQAIITVTPTPTQQPTNTSETTTTTTTNTIINQFFGNQTGSLPLTQVTTSQNTLSDPTSLASQLNRSVESKIIPAPTVTTIDQPTTRDVIRLSGRGIPNSQVILYLFSQQAVIYRVPVKTDGTWEFSHDQSYVDLQPGQHAVYAVTLDAGSNVKSKPTLVKSFAVKKDWRVILAKLIDIPTTIMTIVIVIIGVVWFKMKKRKKGR